MYVMENIFVTIMILIASSGLMALVNKTGMYHIPDLIVWIPAGFVGIGFVFGIILILVIGPIKKKKRDKAQLERLRKLGIVDNYNK